MSYESPFGPLSLSSYGMPWTCLNAARQRNPETLVVWLAVALDPSLRLKKLGQSAGRSLRLDHSHPLLNGALQILHRRILLE
jgi:hypothetical protein